MLNDTFKAEKSIVQCGETILDKNDPSTDFRVAYQQLLNDYKKLLKVSNRVMSISDRNEKRLKIAEVALSKANIRMEDELNAGHSIQMSMLPVDFNLNNRQEFSLYAILQPARETGGDLYDFFFINDNLLCLCIGDVSGKGVPAALFMAVTKTLVQSKASENLSTAIIIDHVNRALCKDNPSCMFVTLFLGLLDITTGEFIYTNAGHNPPYIRHGNGPITLLDQIHGPFAGIEESFHYKEDKIILEQGDHLIMYTDGVTEAINQNNDFFGDPRLLEWITDFPIRDTRQFVEEMLGEVLQFTGEMEQADDITIMVLNYVGVDSLSANEI